MPKRSLNSSTSTNIEQELPELEEKTEDHQDEKLSTAEEPTTNIWQTISPKQEKKLRKKVCTNILCCTTKFPAIHSQYYKSRGDGQTSHKTKNVPQGLGELTLEERPPQTDQEYEHLQELQKILQHLVL